MKIVFLQDDFPPRSMGGAGFSTYELAIGMKRAGHDVSVITTCRRKEDEGENEYDGLTIYSIRSDYPERWRAYRSLNNWPVVKKVEGILKRLTPDVVHANNIHYHLSYRCLKIASMYAKTVVFTARDVMSFHYGKLSSKQYSESYDTYVGWREQVRVAGKRWNPFRNIIIRHYLTYTDKIFAVSTALSNALISNGITAETLHTGTDVTLWGASEEEKISFRKEFNLEGRKVILFSGRLSEGKGGSKVIDAMVHIAKHIPEAVLFVAGSEDAYSERMKYKVGQLGIGDNFIVSGWLDRNKMRIANNIADIVIVPSLYLDPFPRTVVEGMASEKSVIGTCYGGAPEIIIDGMTGYVVNPFHPEGIAKKAVELLSDQKKAEQFGRAGKERIEKNFNLEDKVKEYIVEYEKLIKSKKLKII